MNLRALAEDVARFIKDRVGSDLNHRCIVLQELESLLEVRGALQGPERTAELKETVARAREACGCMSCKPTVPLHGPYTAVNCVAALILEKEL